MSSLYSCAFDMSVIPLVFMSIAYVMQVCCYYSLVNMLNHYSNYGLYLFLSYVLLLNYGSEYKLYYVMIR